MSAKVSYRYKDNIVKYSKEAETSGLKTATVMKSQIEVCENSQIDTAMNLSLEPLVSIKFAVTGMDFLPDRRLVVVYENKKCIIMNDKLQKVGKTFLLKAVPLSVVCMSDSDVAVTLDNKTVCILSVRQDSVIQEKRSFTTKVQYHALRKLDSTTMVGFSVHRSEHARKIKLDGMEEGFEMLKGTDFTSICTGYNCKCGYISSRHILLTCDTNNDIVYLRDAEKGTSKSVKFEQDIYALCQGPEGTVFVLCDDDVVQMTCDGHILRKCGYTSCVNTVCVSKDFGALATEWIASITLYSLTTTTALSLEPQVSLDFSVSGMDFLPDGRLVVVYNNQKCIIMNDKLQKVGKKFVFKAVPLCVVCMSDSEVAVTLNNKTVCILSVRQDNGIQEKRSFKTEVQYHALSKLDPTTMVGCAAEQARKVTLDGVEQDFKSFVKKDYPSTRTVFNYKYACIPCRHILVTLDKGNKTVYLQDPEKGTFKCVQFEQKILDLCQGPAGTVLVICQHKVMQMTCEGQILRTCSNIGIAKNVCANKDFSVIASACITSLKLCRLAIE